MLFDAAVLLGEGMTDQLVELMREIFPRSSVYCGQGNVLDSTEVYITFEADNLDQAMRFVIQNLASVAPILSMSIDVVNGDGHRPPPLSNT